MLTFDDRYNWNFSIGGGISEEIETIKMFEDFKESESNVVWDITNGGTIIAQPVIYKDVVYFGCYDGIMYAVSLEGVILWKFVTDGSILSKVAVYNDKIYFCSYDGHAYCISLNGSLIWKLYIGSPIVSSPLVLDKVVYFG
ncbi:MAG TPA: PQQ-binding-like beta-propeller repeat protein, partial [archaeon]|nr:PQQ-binding-like beta-propeller repeat protein [archaeon]